jgi:CBS domain-containing protein
MLVRDFMNYQVISATPTTTVKEVLTMFEENRIGGVPVVDEKGCLVGIITDGDILRFLSPNKERYYVSFYMAYITAAETLEDVLKEGIHTQIGNMMVKKNLKTLTPDNDLETAIRIISSHHFKKVPVVNGAGRVVGIVSRGDIIKFLSQKTTDKHLLGI